MYAFALEKFFAGAKIKLGICQHTLFKQKRVALVVHLARCRAVIRLCLCDLYHYMHAPVEFSAVLILVIRLSRIAVADVHLGGLLQGGARPDEVRLSSCYRSHEGRRGPTIPGDLTFIFDPVTLNHTLEVVTLQGNY